MVAKFRKAKKKSRKELIEEKQEAVKRVGAVFERHDEIFASMKADQIKNAETIETQRQNADLAHQAMHDGEYDLVHGHLHEILRIDGNAPEDEQNLQDRLQASGLDPKQLQSLIKLDMTPEERQQVFLQGFTALCQVTKMNAAFAHIHTVEEDGKPVPKIMVGGETEHSAWLNSRLTLAVEYAATLEKALNRAKAEASAAIEHSRGGLVDLDGNPLKSTRKE